MNDCGFSNGVVYVMSPNGNIDVLGTPTDISIETRPTGCWPYEYSPYTYEATIGFIPVGYEKGEIMHYLAHTLGIDIEKVIYNPPATIVVWSDGSKTVVKCMEGEEFDREKGFLLCVAKRIFGRDFHKTLRRWR